MSDTQVSEGLLRKIQALLNLKNHANTSEEEAAAAAGMIQKLTTQYNIDLHQIEGAGAKTSGNRAKKQHDRAAMYKHQKALMECLAKNNFCKHWVVEVQVPHEKKAGEFRRAKRHMLLGRAVNVQATEMTYDYLIDTMDRLLPWQGMDKRGKSALLWLLGCTERLVVRLTEQRAAAEAESQRKAEEEAMRTRHPSAASSGNALVLVDIYANEDDLNNDFINGWEPGTTTARKLARKAEQEAHHAEFKTKVAVYQAKGYSYFDAIDHASYGDVLPDWLIKMRADQTKKDAKPETDAQRRKREEKWERDQANYQWREQKRNAHRYTAEFQMGVRAADNIGLDPQVGNTKVGAIK